jgi:prolyl-tRNA synthetase
MHKSEQVRETCEKLYVELQKAGIDVLFMDEEKARLGGMLADVELMGLPHRIVVGDRGLENGLVEYRNRRESENRDIPLDEICQFIRDELSA